jgi:hypothetical protein
MKIGKVLFSIIFSIPILTVAGQNRPVLDTVLINDICIENICFGDSISKIIKYFGTPDEITHTPAEEWEFAEPPHNTYWYDNTLFYEILYPMLSDSLLYGCRIDKEKVTISIKGTKIIIGKTCVDDILSIFKLSASSIVVDKYSKEYYIAIDVILSPSLNEVVKGAFIYEINLYFTSDKILRKVETNFDLN